MEPATPSNIGPYTVLDLLGNGSAGDVYRANDPRSGKEVALKILRRTAPQDLERFREEASAVRKLQHRNIVEVFEFEQVDGLYYLAMSYVPGKTLASVAPMAVTPALEMFQSICSAIDYAHRQGVIHLDLKPANILLDPERGPQIVDFGLARETLLPQPDTMSRYMLGTPGFLSPEQAQGAPVNGAADIFSLGATLYFLLTGQAAFEAPSAAQSLALTLTADFPRPSKINPEIPREVEAIILKAMSRDTRRRFATAGEMGEEIARFLSGKTPASVFEVFADAVSFEQDCGWRVRRKVLVVGEIETLVDQLEPDRIALYETWTAQTVEDALSSISDFAIDAVVVAGTVGNGAAIELFKRVRGEQPDAIRVYVSDQRQPLPAELIQGLINEGGVTNWIDINGPEDPLGVALDKVFRSDPGRRSVAGSRDEIQRLRRELRAMQESAIQKNRDLQAKSVYLEEKVAELTRMKRTFVNLSSELQQRNSEIDEARKRIEELSVTDELTGVLNRRGFFGAARRDARRARRFETQMALLMLDVDHFKRINDTYGHQAGDAALKTIASMIAAAVRDTDVFGRVGGEEFCVLLANTQLEGAQVVAERIRAAIDEREIDLPKVGLVKITVSIGVAIDQSREQDVQRLRRGSKPPGAHDSDAADGPLEEMIHAADAALYRAKQQGRNRVEVAVVSTGPTTATEGEENKP
ncbi:MAG: diguanylate cyclase [Kofleriaceae bacterium]